MNRFKFEAVRREFPFAFPDHLDAKQLDSVQVKRLDDLNVGYLRSEFVDVGNSLFTRREDTKVSIYGKEGHSLGLLTQSRTVGSIGVQHQPDAECDGKGETLLEWCLIHRDVLDDVGFVVEDRGGYDSTSDDREWRSMVIYKPPKGHTLREFVDTAVAKAAAEVKTESTF